MDLPRRTDESLTRRRALALGYVNGALWATGNALSTGTLVNYLLLDLGARDDDIAYLLAIPALVGLLRIAAPALIVWIGGVRPACLRLTLASYLLFGLVPLAAAAVDVQLLPDGRATIALIIGLVTVHQLFEYLGTVALWGWLAELVPPRIRGRYFARRQVWQLTAAIPLLWITSAASDALRTANPGHKLLAYAIPTALGALLLVVSLVPLQLMPSYVGRPMKAAVPPRVSPAHLWAPLVDRRFAWLIVFGCWLSLANGLTQAAQNTFPYRVLQLGVLPLNVMRTITLVGQFLLGLWIGRACDRLGNRPVLMASTWLIAAAPLFYLVATPAEPYWIAGAFVMWSMYVGQNVAAPNLWLKCAPPGAAASYVAAYEATRSVVYAVGVIAGGYLVPWLDGLAARYAWGITGFQALFLFAWAARSAAIVWLLPVDEPGAIGWRDIRRRLFGRGGQARIAE